MSAYLNSRKKIILTRHFAEKWADRIAASGTIAKSEQDKEIIPAVRLALETKAHKLVYDGEEHNGKKYRMVCEVKKEAITLVVVDTEKALVFKTAWKAKPWEKSYFREAGL